MLEDHGTVPIPEKTRSCAHCGQDLDRSHPAWDAAGPIFCGPGCFFDYHDGGED